MPEPAVMGPAWGRDGPVRAFATTRRGGVATGRQATLSLDARTDAGDADALAVNRRRLRSALDLPSEPVWLRQVHGTAVVDASAVAAERPEADAAWTATPGVVCAVTTADCLPVVLAERSGRAVAVAHAGWRGLAAGVIEAVVGALPADAGRLRAWLGPAIGPGAFEVGPEVRAAFVDHDARASEAFRPGRGDRWHADLYRLARQRLARLGVTDVSGGGRCTAGEPRHFFSHRRDGTGAGRMAVLAWIPPTRT